MGRLSSFVFVIALVVLSTTVHAQDAATDEARLAFVRGTSAYEAGRYDEALTAFQHAYALTHAPELLYNIASVAERLRQDELAIESYERYLRETPGASDRDVVESRLRILRGATAEQREAEEAHGREVEDAERRAREEERAADRGASVDGTAPHLYGAARVGEASASGTSPALAIDASLDLAFHGDHVRFAAMMAGAGFDVSIFSMAATASARLRYGPFGLEIGVPVEVFSGDADDASLETQTTFGMGNVDVAAFGVGDVEAGPVRLTFRGGLGLALPTAYHRPASYDGCTGDLAQIAGCIVDEYYASLASVYGYYVAAAQAGGWQAYRYAFDHWAFFVPFGVEAWIDRVGFLAFDGLFSLHVNDDYEDTADLALAIEGGVEIASFLRVSARLLGYGVLLHPAYDDANGGVAARAMPNDDFQLSVEPRVTFAYESFFARASVLVNLDEPWGVGGGTADNAAGVWSARLTVGLRI